MIADSEPPASLQSKTKVKPYLFLLVVSGLAVYFFLPRFAVMGHALLMISNLRIPFVVLSVLAQLLSYLGSGYMLTSVVNLAGSSVSVIEGTLITTGANSVGTLGGGVLGTAGMTYLWLRRRGVNAGAAGLGSWLPIFFNETILASVSLAGLILAAHRSRSAGLLIVGFALVCLILVSALIALILCLLYREKLPAIAIAIVGFVAKVRRRRPDRSKIIASVGQLLDGWDALLRGGWRKPVAAASINTGFDMLCLGLLFWSAGYRIGVVVLVAGYGIPQLLGKLTFILGGVGVVETGMVGLYILLGAPRPSAVIAVLAYRLFSFWIPTLVGVALIPYFERSAATPLQGGATLESGRNSGK